MKRALLACAVFLAIAATCRAAPDGYRRIESVAASVDGEVVFLSDVEREACFYRCGTVPGQAPREMTLSRAREMRIADTLVLQEQKKLGLGSVDNAALAAEEAGALSRTRKCASPCAVAVTVAEIHELVQRRLLVRDFLERRVAVFIEVNDEEVRREIALRTRSGAPPEERSEEKVRKDLLREKGAAEIRNWFARATSKSRITLSPLSEP
ncbi:MAG: hypothetical protein FIA93_12405 [Deltaproteobacteria bacterium]|nr:hypothetical protein [Deltaproteobacteria bacterium]PWB67194.1 MAG: hypothetical protein C3F14_02760 [Deltaproteobacteria bacterium]